MSMGGDVTQQHKAWQRNVVNQPSLQEKSMAETYSCRDPVHAQEAREQRLKRDFKRNQQSLLQTWSRDVTFL
eukprot:scaffold207052_cov19-Tisochrysis_lutea.AAC.1